MALANLGATDAGVAEPQEQRKHLALQASTISNFQPEVNSAAENDNCTPFVVPLELMPFNSLFFEQNKTQFLLELVELKKRFDPTCRDTESRAISKGCLQKPAEIMEDL